MTYIYSCRDAHKKRNEYTKLTHYNDSSNKSKIRRNIPFPSKDDYLDLNRWICTAVTPFDRVVTSKAYRTSPLHFFPTAEKLPPASQRNWGQQSGYVEKRSPGILRQPGPAPTTPHDNRSSKSAFLFPLEQDTFPQLCR